MGREFYNNRGEELHMEVSMWTYLSEITVGLFKKLSVLYPLDEFECKVIKRILKNHIHYNKENYYNPYKNVPKLEDKEIVHIEREVIPFFSNTKWIKEDR